MNPVCYRCSGGPCTLPDGWTHTGATNCTHTNGAQVWYAHGDKRWRYQRHDLGIVKADGECETRDDAMAMVAPPLRAA